MRNKLLKNVCKMKVPGVNNDCVQGARAWSQPGEGGYMEDGASGWPGLQKYDLQFQGISQTQEIAVM